MSIILQRLTFGYLRHVFSIFPYFYLLPMLYLHSARSDMPILFFSTHRFWGHTTFFGYPSPAPLIRLVEFVFLKDIILTNMCKQIYKCNMSTIHISHYLEEVQLLKEFSLYLIVYRVIRVMRAIETSHCLHRPILVSGSRHCRSETMKDI